jgi:hypothetical protein
MFTRSGAFTMIGLMVLALVGIAIFVVLTGLFALAALVKAVLWAIFLPFRLLFGVLFLPLLLVKLIVGGVLFVIVAPLVLIAVAGTLVATVTALAVPFFPLLCIAFVVWVVMRATRPAIA